MFHQGGTISTVLTGATVRPVGDRHRVSHEELSYIVDSTASPAATIIPFNVWPIYVGGLVAGTVPVIATQEQAIAFFFKAVPFNFYALFAVTMTLLLAVGTAGETVMLAAKDNELVGAIAVADTLKEDSVAAVRDLEQMGIQTAMLTGDNQTIARSIARETGIDVPTLAPRISAMPVSRPIRFC